MPCENFTPMSAACGFTILALVALAALKSRCRGHLGSRPRQAILADRRGQRQGPGRRRDPGLSAAPAAGLTRRRPSSCGKRTSPSAAFPAAAKPYVAISGQGFDYSGAGSTPRAIFQFNPGADNCTLEGFELSGAHNSSHNGAGVRINQANHVAIRNCSIHDNDMGIMSNGDGSLATAVDQRIEECRIYRNGDPTEPGYNHNLYLGGTSVTLRFCEIHHSLTGHNVKSRAHHTRVEYCYVHHSANREFDLVDAAETARPQSDAVLLGNIIVKDPKCSGNRAVIHFGQDGGKGHNGTLYLAFNTIVTPFISPVVELSAAGAKARLAGQRRRQRHSPGGPESGRRPRRRRDAEYRRRVELVLRRFFRARRPAWTPGATISSRRPAICFRAARRQLSTCRSRPPSG